MNIVHLERSIELVIKEGRVPGLALAIVQGKEVIYARGFGRTSVADASLAITPETLFGIGSITKPLTGTVILRLVERGDLELDTPVRAYVPDLKLSDTSALQQITLRMLLTHMTGLPTSYQTFGPRDPQGLEAWVREELPTLPFLAPPGKIYSYSNPGINLAGYVAQVAGGRFYAELMADEVFRPLDMQRTTFDPLVALTYPAALPHYCPDGKTLQVFHRFADNSGNRPSGYAISNVLDLANFAIMQMHSGSFAGKQVLSPNSVSLMQSPLVDLYTPTKASYGLTLRSELYKGVRIVGHDGDVNSFLGRLIMAPEAKIAVVILANWPADLGHLSNLILDDLLNLSPPTPGLQESVPEPGNEADLSGWYMGRFGLAKILVRDGHLMLDFNGEAFSLSSYRPDGYIGRSESGAHSVAVGFPSAEPGPAPYLMLDESCYLRIPEDSLPDPDPATWEGYAGTYTAIFDTWTVRIRKGRLLLRSEEFGEEMVCKPLDRTRFICPVGLIEFGDVKAGMAHTLRTYVLRFTRIENDR